MVSSINHLLVDELFRDELSSAMAALDHQHHPSAIRRLQLDFDEDGNISTLNEVHLKDGVRHKLSYLIGSINFLFNLIVDNIAEEIAGSGTEEELLSCKRKVVLLAIDLLLELSKATSQEEVNEVIEKISQRKMAIKKQLVQ